MKVKEIEFHCPECGNDRLIEIINRVTLQSYIDTLHIQNGRLSYSVAEDKQYTVGGQLSHYECSDCEKLIAESKEELLGQLEQFQLLKQINKQNTDFEKGETV